MAGEIIIQRLCANCGDHHGRGEVCATHWEARLTGLEDAQAGEPTHADEWPSGTYGHADYWLGFYGSEAK